METTNESKQTNGIIFQDESDLYEEAKQGGSQIKGIQGDDADNIDPLETLMDNSMYEEPISIDLLKPIPIFELATEFEVRGGAKVKDHIQYDVLGEDSRGKFNKKRRYNDFFALRNALSMRWPGFYIPQLPEKKIVSHLFFIMLSVDWKH